MSKDTKSRIHLAPTSYVSSWIPARNRRNSEFIFFGGQDGQLSIPVQVKYLDSVDTCKNCHVETLKGSQRRLQQLRESGETWDAVQEMMISRTVHAMCLHIAIVYIYIIYLYIAIYLNLLHWTQTNVSCVHHSLWFFWHANGILNVYTCIYDIPFFCCASDFPLGVIGAPQDELLLRVLQSLRDGILRCCHRGWRRLRVFKK